MIALLIQFTVFLSYVGYIYSKFGILDSISESWYRLEIYNQSYLFTLFCFAVGILMLFHGDNVFYFLACSGLCFTGTASAFKDKGSWTDIIHYTGAVVAIGCSLAGLCVVYGVFVPTIITVLSIILFMTLKIPHSLWWIEIVSFLSIMSGILTTIL